jgi:hypothetical protein
VNDVTVKLSSFYSTDGAKQPRLLENLVRRPHSGSVRFGVVQFPIAFLPLFNFVPGGISNVEGWGSAYLEWDVA